MWQSRRLRGIPHADDYRYRAVIHGFGVSHAPVNVIVQAHPIGRALCFVEVAKATGAGGPAAAVVITHKIVLPVPGIVAGPHPGYF